MLESTTIAAIATPLGRGGIGMIRLSGSEALTIAKKLSSREVIKPRFAHLCAWKDAAGEVIDSGILLYFPNPASYTGEDVVELQGHGSPVLLHALLQRCFALGAVAAEPGEFTRRAVEQGRMDLSQAEAVIACIDAATERAAKQALRHLSGEFGLKIEALMGRLTGIVAHVEACLDFPEEEIPDLFLHDLQEQLQQELLQPMQKMLLSSTFGERLFSGVTIAIVGAPNVGKSSLLNALSGRDRAIVSDIAGTTRDVLEIDFEVQGIPIRLVDTAGMRETTDSIEKEGVRRAKQAADLADVVIFLVDASDKRTWHYDAHYDIRLINKSDLFQKIPDDIKNDRCVSATTGQGIADFMVYLGEYLGASDTSGEDVFITSARHRQAIQTSEQLILKTLPMLLSEEQLDLAALSLRQAWTSLGAILGIGDVEHILDRVFSEFCIGK
ncbi:MAG: tRNA uridine-5-carboxymethylaminomethyl(34) synthesis GTPase MnmE [Zetaproteobacteria bacterium]|nr:tRNA uridine-5-carboxymethylaminomethyl(34) synthesis GTPase MnmE [Zetaproteobacteria bacterium]